MKRLGSIVFLCVVLSSCSVLDVAKTALGMGGGGPSLDVETTFGDKNQEVQVGDQVTAESVQITNELDYWLLIIAICGWVLPTPVSMFNGIRKKIT